MRTRAVWDGGNEMSSEEVMLEKDGFVSVVFLNRPPHNFFCERLLAELADCFENLDNDPNCRVIVLGSRGKSFCAGADFSSDHGDDRGRDGAKGIAAQAQRVYRQALRLFRIRKPIVAAVHGAAIGGGLGLALAADFRVTCPEARFSANFTRLGIHPGFGLTVTLPRLVGQSAASLMMLTSRRFGGADAVAIGLANVLVEQDAVLEASTELAGEIAECAPLATISTRRTMRANLADRVAEALEFELSAQSELMRTRDFTEGVKAMAERRAPKFTGN